MNSYNLTFNYSINKFYFLIQLFIILQVFGAYGGLFQPSRVFFIFGIPFFIVSFLNKKNWIYNKFEFWFFLFWIFYAFFSSIWSLIPLDSFKETIILIFNFSSFFLLIFLSNKIKNPRLALINAWLILFVLTIPIALYEFLFDNHLSLSYGSESSIINYNNGNVALRNFASVTYMNLNGYNVMLCYMIPFVMSKLFYNKTVLKKYFFWTLYFFLVYIILKNGSRAASLNLIISMLVFAFYYIEKKSTFVKFSLSIVFLLLLISYFFIDEFSFIALRVSEEGLSDARRLLVIDGGLRALIDSYFFGIGAGNFVAVMENIYMLDLTSPHNFLLEIVVQYGIIILFLFMGLFYRLYKKMQKSNSKTTRFIIMSSILTFPLTSVIDSGYLQSIYPWLFISSLFIIVNQKLISETND